jgi:hypothetical protein
VSNDGSVMDHGRLNHGGMDCRASNDRALPDDTLPEAARRARDYVGCAAICRRLDEPLTGTAPSAAVGWLLIEHPGPWPAFGLPHDVPAPVARFALRALEYGVRTQLIRRPDRTGRQAASPTVMIAGGTQPQRWLEQCILTDPRALAELDPAGFGGCAPGFGTPAEAALLVCTHGRREVCCAKYGRPVAAALAERFGALVWETTHVGGDRFAANLVLLPSGRYFGRLDPDDAVRVAEAALRGRIDLDRFRGTAGLPEPAQAAECLLRRALGIAQTDAVRYLADTVSADPESSGDTESGPPRSQSSYTCGVRFAVAGSGVREVTLERHETADPRLTSCTAGTVETPTGYRLLAITAPDDDRAVGVRAGGVRVGG